MPGIVRPTALPYKPGTRAPNMVEQAAQMQRNRLSGYGYIGHRVQQTPVERATEAGQAVRAGLNAANGTGGTGGVATTPGPVGGIATGGASANGPAGLAVPRVGPPDPKTGTDAAMLRAKDRSGLLARGALTGLREAMGERGMLGGGVESRATTAIAAKGLEELSDVSREHAIKESDQAARFAELGYQGDITQRGQDITTRGQDLNAQLAREGRFQSQQQMLTQSILDALKAQLY